MVPTNTLNSHLYVKGQRLDIHSNQGRFVGLHHEARRAQLVMCSEYSDLVIASSQINNNHGSTLTFASYNPANTNDFRKWIVNQGNWGNRIHMLEFGYSTSNGRTNPHSNINNADTVLTLDGAKKRVGIGTRSPVHSLDVSGIARVQKLQLGNKWLLSGIGDRERNDDWLRLKNTTTAAYYGGFAANKLWTGNGGTVKGSDLRLKKYVSTIGKALESISKLRGVRFKWRNSQNKSSYDLGFVAQEVEKIFPELVEMGPDGMKGIKYSGLIAPLIEAMKQQHTQITDLINHVRDLQVQLEDVKAQI